LTNFYNAIGEREKLRWCAPCWKQREKYRSAASVLCGAHIGQSQRSCPVCRAHDLAEECDKLLDWRANVAMLVKDDAGIHFDDVAPRIQALKDQVARLSAAPSPSGHWTREPVPEEWSGRLFMRRRDTGEEFGPEPLCSALNLMADRWSTPIPLPGEERSEAGEVERLTKARDGWKYEAEIARDALAVANERLTLLGRHGADEFWTWERDGDNKLDSLACPVLIQAADLRAALARAHDEAIKDAMEAVRKEGAVYNDNTIEWGAIDHAHDAVRALRRGAPEQGQCEYAPEGHNRCALHAGHDGEHEQPAPPRQGVETPDNELVGWTPTAPQREDPDVAEERALSDMVRPVGYADAPAAPQREERDVFEAFIQEQLRGVPDKVEHARARFGPALAALEMIAKHGCGGSLLSAPRGLLKPHCGECAWCVAKDALAEVRAAESGRRETEEKK
jgi:hypothetical protein